MGKRRTTPGTRQIGAEVDADLLDAFKAFVEARGDTLRKHLEMAMRRHLQNPPPAPPEPPPLPPMTAPPDGPAPKKPRKGKEKPQ